MTITEIKQLVEQAWERDRPRQQVEAERIAREVSKPRPGD